MGYTAVLFPLKTGKQGSLSLQQHQSSLAIRKVSESQVSLKQINKVAGNISTQQRENGGPENKRTQEMQSSKSTYTLSFSFSFFTCLKQIIFTTRFSLHQYPSTRSHGKYVTCNWGRLHGYTTCTCTGPYAQKGNSNILLLS